MKAQSIKEPTDKMDFIKIENLLLFKRHCQEKKWGKKKKKATDWKKAFANHMSNNVFVCRIYKELSHFNKKTNKKIKSRQEIWKYILSKKKQAGK